ncbi:MAG: hypothetical protein MJ114_06555 [Acetatifactor sp.]|nr:hypothetical protein [Acetatifactor sp.]
MGLLDRFKKRNNPTINFRGKEIAYEVENTEKHAKIIIGVDGKLKNPWNEPCLLRVTLNKENGKLVIYIAKDQAGIADAKPIYSSNAAEGVFSDAFPVSDDELQTFRELLTKLITEEQE